MTSGRVNLVFKGVEDEIIYGEPSFSYFLKNFPRQSRFYRHVVDLPGLSNKIEFGSKSRLTIPLKGDLIKNIYFRFTLPKIDVPYLRIIRGAGLFIFEYMDLYIGGQLIERVTSDLMYQSMLLSSNYFELAGLNFINEFKYSDTTDPYTNVFPRTMFSILPFYFSKHIGLALPVFALQKQKVEIEFKLRTYSQILQFANPAYNAAVGYLNPADLDNTSNYSLGITTFPVEYIFLDEPVKQYMRNSELSYLITQTQLRNFIQPASLVETTKTIDLKFINPVKELFFLVNDSNTFNTYFLPGGSNADGNLWFKGCNFYRGTPANTGWSTLQQLKQIELRFNDEIMFNESYRLFQSYFPSFYYTNGTAFSIGTKGGAYYAAEGLTQDDIDSTYMYCYSFAENPENHAPTGQVNFSRIRDQKLKLTFYENTRSRYVRIYARSYNVLKVRDGLAGLMFTHNSDYDLTFM